MSLSQYLFNEFRPLFSLMDDGYDPYLQRRHGRRHHQGGGGEFWQSPALNVHEEQGTYIVEAEVPGVKKENVNLRVGDGGRSLTIEGRALNRFSSSSQPTSPSAVAPEASSSAYGDKNDAVVQQEGTNKDVARTGDQNNQVSQYSSQSSRTFSRTVWLPDPIEPNNVKAKLEDGILTVRAPKINQESISINID